MAVSGKTDYIKVSSYEGRKGEVKKVVLLYSGGLDTSTMVKWIQEEYKAEVIALTIDIGQQTDDLEAIRQKALKLGAIKAIVVDAKEEFADEYISRGIKANGMYQGRYYLSTPLGRPLLAKWAVKIAAIEGADAIAHGATGKGNDQIRMEGSALALNPDIKIIAPVREWGMGRNEQIEYCLKHGIPVKQTKDKPYSYDDNMWGVTGEGGEIENPMLIPPLDKILQVCKTPEQAKNTPEYIKIEFEKGLPVAVDGKQMTLVEIIGSLNKRGAEHAIGIVHLLEDRVIGLKVRGLYEAPAAETIITAHKALERYTSTRLENEFKSIVDEKWAYLCYGALWFEPLMEDLNAYEDKVNEKITGTVTVKLFKGHAEAVAVETPNTIFDEKLATFMEEDHSFNQNASAGFIEHYTMQMKLAQRRQRTALLAIGGRDQKLKLLPQVKALHQMKYQLYATYKTHKFLKKHGIEAIVVNKISSPELKPNLNDLLDANRFDIIINIPSTSEARDANEKEKTDGQVIREKAVKTNTPLVTTVSVAREVVNKLSKARV
ncbi:MAG TPA: argininosuccinate synthase [Candidatus Saccharimonadales bacterium]|nr:argininosuccinate synthase [Candidatus Saccharimonadales bacterium]